MSATLSPYNFNNNNANGINVNSSGNFNNNNVNNANGVRPAIFKSKVNMVKFITQSAIVEFNQNHDDVKQM